MEDGRTLTADIDDYVNIDEEYCRTTPQAYYVTISKGKVKETDSVCVYCCWRIAEIFKAFILPLFYTLVVAGCCVYCYQIVSNFIASQKHPIETLRYEHTSEYEAPGIALFLHSNATFISCEKFYIYDDQEVRYGKGGLSAILLNLKQSASVPCQMATIAQYDSKTARKNVSIIVFKGPQNVERREYMKVHFTMDHGAPGNEHAPVGMDVGFLEFFPFANFTEWVEVYNSSEKYLQEKEKLQDIWPLAMGFITYSRLAIRVFKNGTSVGRHKTVFNPVNDIVKYLPPSEVNYTARYENMYGIFEWRDSEFEVVEEIVTQGLWTTIGLMVTAVLTILRMTDLTKVIVRRQKVRLAQNRLNFFNLCCPCCTGEEGGTQREVASSSDEGRRTIND